MMSIVTTVDNEFLENFHLLYNEKHDNNTLKFYKFDQLINGSSGTLLFITSNMGRV